MASPPPPPLPVPTTISELSDDLLREIFLRLPSVTSLARAAFSCRAFLRAVRSSPTFRRRFCELHAPPLLALFLVPQMDAVIPTAAGRRSTNPDIAAAFADLLRDDGASEWCVESEIPYSCGYVCFINRNTDQLACYNPHSEALNIFPNKPYNGDERYLEFHTLHPDGEERHSRVVCVHREQSWAWVRVAIFSSDTMEWQTLPEARNLLLEGDRYTTGMVVSSFVCWVHKKEGCILALSTGDGEFQFIRMDLPPPLKGPLPTFMLGQTRDGKLCIVDVHECNLSVWLWTADDDGVERFMLHRMFPLHTCVKEVTEHSEEDIVEVQLMTVINGLVYLSIVYRQERQFSECFMPFWLEPQSSQCFLSFCLETGEVNLLLKESRHFPFPVDPYIMTSWPSSLIYKKDSEIEVKEDVSEDHGPVGTEETSPVLLTSLHSFKETLIDDDSVNFVEIDAFLPDDEKNLLVNRITTLESGLATARERVLRIGADSDNRKEMERSRWQMCKEMLARACPRFVTG